MLRSAVRLIPANRNRRYWIRVSSMAQRECNPEDTWTTRHSSLFGGRLSQDTCRDQTHARSSDRPPYRCLVQAVSAGKPQALPTLDGKPSLIVAHRGAGGYLPEETYEAYVRAIEPDLIMTKDHVLIARHDPNLAISTNVASLPQFADRKRTRNVDGEIQEG